MRRTTTRRQALPASQESVETRAAAGDGILHPVAIAAILLLIANDHALKPLAPGPATGKISDFAGLVFFPILLVSGYEVAKRVRGTWPGPTVPPIVLAVLATGVVFTAVKLSPAGELVYEHMLGIAQWPFAAVAALPGGLLPTGPRSVDLTRDPTDLIALGALGIPYAISVRRVRQDVRRVRQDQPGTGRRRLPAANRFRYSLTLVLIVTASTTSIATSEAPASAGASHTETILLSADRPVSVRHLSFEIAENDPSDTSVVLGVSAWTRQVQDGMQVQVPATNVHVSIIPDEPTHGIAPSVDSLDPASLDLSERCARGCRHGAIVIVRLTDAAPLGGAEILLDATLSVTSIDFERDRLDVSVALTSDADRRFDGRPPVASSRVDRILRVSTERPTAEDGFELEIPATVLRPPLAYPLVGRIRTGVETVRASSHPNAHYTRISVGAVESWMVVGEEPLDLDWLSQCTPSQECVVRVSIASEYQREIQDDPRAPGFVELRWYVEARLEALDGRPLPEDALTLRSGD